MIKKHIPVLVVGLLIVLVALAGGAVYGINKLIPSRKQMDLTEYYGQNADGEAALILGTEKLEEKALILGEDVYLPLDVVNGYLNQKTRRYCMQHHPVSRRNRLQIRQTETCG